MALRCLLDHVVDPYYSQSGSDLYWIEALGTMDGDGEGTHPYGETYSPEAPDYIYTYPNGLYPMGMGVDWADLVEPQITNMNFPYILGRPYIVGYRNTWRSKPLDRIGAINPADVAEAWTNVKIWSPEREDCLVEYGLFEQVPEGWLDLCYVNGAAKHFCSRATITTTNNLTVSMGLMRIIPHGDELRADVISAAESLASNYNTTPWVKFDVTNAARAIIAAKDSCRSFQWFFNADTGFDYTAEQDWNATLRKIHEKYYTADLTYQTYRSWADGHDYLQGWGSGSVRSTMIRYSAAEIGIMWARLTNGKVLALTDRVFYGRPPRTQE
ncbi:MAG: hypothetical protein ABFD89_01625 [Bryobacteraceae bacterium]